METRKAALRADGVRLPGGAESAEGGEVGGGDAVGGGAGGGNEGVSTRSEGTVLSEEELLEQLGIPGELMPRGLSAAYESLAARDETLPASQGQQAVVGLLRVLDVDLSGGISVDDLVQSVLHHTKSAWITGKSASRFRVARLMPTSRGKLAPSSPNTPKGGTTPKGAKTPRA